MPPAKKPQSSKSSASASSAPPQTKPGDSTRAKRKHADANDAVKDGSDNRMQKQPRQNSSPDRSIPPTAGDTSISPHVLLGINSISTVDGDGFCLEVEAPSVRSAQGDCIRLHGRIYGRIHGPVNYWDRTYLLPFALIETIIISRYRYAWDWETAYEFLIVPIKGTGVAPVRDPWPDMYTFSFVDAKDGAQRYGSRTYGIDKSTPLLDLFKNVLSERLAVFGKTVIDISNENEASCPIFQIEATLEFVTHTDLKVETKGTLQFLDGGMLFRTEDEKVTLWIPAQQLKDLCLVFVTNLAEWENDVFKFEIVGLELNLDVLRTPTTQRPGVSDCDRLRFPRLPLTLAKSLYRYAEKQNIHVSLVEQQFYKDQCVAAPKPLAPSAKEELLGITDTT
ncbi:hypothetical protein F4808DRAFT_195420 [Astrocystis sublimbata]|nr:hypothetical protein F4808DRAFT_195420 [Astrocystis sublimbata]